MEKKPSSFLHFFKRINGKASSGGGSRRWKSKISTGVRWKRRSGLRLWFFDSILFRIISVLEAIVLVSKLCFFFVCYGFRL